MSRRDVGSLGTTAMMAMISSPTATGQHAEAEVFSENAMITKEFGKIPGQMEELRDPPGTIIPKFIVMVSGEM